MSSLHDQLRIIQRELEECEKEWLAGSNSPRKQLELVRAINAKQARINRLEQEIHGSKPEPLLKLVS